MMKKKIVILCTLDTKWKKIEFLKEVIVKRGHQVMLLDLSLGKEPPVSGDITPAEVAAAAGSDIKIMRELAGNDRGEATKIMTKGAIAKTKELLESGQGRFSYAPSSPSLFRFFFSTDPRACHYHLGCDLALR